MEVTIVVFVLVYVAMGIGHLPSLRLSRSGAAVVGALAMMVTGAIGQEAAWNAIDYRAIGMLFGLMVVSGAFVVSGFYAFTAQRLASLDVTPPVLLAVIVVAGGLLSAVLTNDVVVVAMTPLLVAVTLARGLNPVPFLLAFCFATNTGSAGTVIGSPQNMIVAQILDLSFMDLLKVTAVPALLSLPLVWGILAFCYRGRWTLNTQAASALQAKAGEAQSVSLDRLGTAKAAIVMLAVVVAFIFSSWPRELIALAGAGALLLSHRVTSDTLMKQVDGGLLLLIMGLFVVNGAMIATGLPADILTHARSYGINLDSPLTLFWVSAVISDLVTNNPAVILLSPFVQSGTQVDVLGAALVLGTNFSSNLIIFGSLAGIIVVEQAAAKGVAITFGEFARAGLPVTIACMLLAAGWLMLLGT